MEKKELTSLARQILAKNGAVSFYTQQEFDETLAILKAEIMAIAIETSKRAVFIERKECARLVSELASQEDEGEVATALMNAARAIYNRIPSQMQ